MFVRNLARSAWDLSRAEEAGADELLLAAYHRKSNGGPRVPAFGLSLRFEPGGTVTVAAADLAESPDLLARTSVARCPRGRALSVAELSEQVGAPEATVGRTVRRLRGDGWVVPVGDLRPGRWGLASS